MNRRTAPDDEELARLIQAAFEALPGPDDERLAAVGERLVQQSDAQKKASRNRRHSWYWLWLLLAGGTVAAAWFVNDYMHDDPAYEQPAGLQQKQSQAVPQSMDNEDNALSGETDRKSDQEPRAKQDSPIIYKREGY